MPLGHVGHGHLSTYAILRHEHLSTRTNYVDVHQDARLLIHGHVE